MILKMKFNGLFHYYDKVTECTGLDKDGFIHYERNGESLSQNGFEECYLLNDNGVTVENLSPRGKGKLELKNDGTFNIEDLKAEIIDGKEIAKAVLKGIQEGTRRSGKDLFCGA